MTGFARGVLYAQHFNTQIYHHSTDTLSCVHLLWPTVHQSAFHEDAF